MLSEGSLLNPLRIQVSHDEVLVIRARPGDPCYFPGYQQYTSSLIQPDSPFRSVAIAGRESLATMKGSVKLIQSGAVRA